MKRFIYIAISTLLTNTGLAQTDSLVRILPVKINFEKKFVIPLEDNNYLYEYYTYLKGAYLLNTRDTLTSVSDSTYEGSNVIMNFDKYEEYPVKHKCDSLINFIRNSSLSFRTFLMIADSASLNIGIDNKQFESVQYEVQPTTKEQYRLCHDQYIELNSEWEESQLKTINDIRKEKQIRYQEALNRDAIDIGFVEAFLDDFGACEPDQRTLLTLISKNPNITHRALTNLSEMDFYTIQLKLSRLPDNISTRAAIDGLESIESKSKYKRKLMRTLKKHKS